MRDRVRPVVAGLLFAYLVLVVCPIRCWQQSDSVDGTWVFALNQAAAHGLTFGRDVVFTAGPLGYLAFPQVVGNNPVSGLLFQTAAWTVLILILADLFFRARFPLWNLVFFSALVGIASPFFWFNNMGLENLLLMVRSSCSQSFAGRGEACAT